MLAIMNFKTSILCNYYCIETILNVQHYTTTEVETAALAANAGICLEDSNTADNDFSKLGDAVNNVILLINIKRHGYAINSALKE